MINARDYYDEILGIFTSFYFIPFLSAVFPFFHFDREN